MFYHLWFFYAIIVVYLVSPLIKVKPVSGRYLAILILLLAVVANPQTSKFSLDDFRLLPANLYIYGDTFYYLLYALLGRAMGMLETQGRMISWGAALLFVVSVICIAISTENRHELMAVLLIRFTCIVARWCSLRRCRCGFGLKIV